MYLISPEACKLSKEMVYGGWFVVYGNQHIRDGPSAISYTP
jgi:hypothetical protein